MCKEVRDPQWQPKVELTLRLSCKILERLLITISLFCSYWELLSERRRLVLERQFKDASNFKFHVGNNFSVFYSRNSLLDNGLYLSLICCWQTLVSWKLSNYVRGSQLSRIFQISKCKYFNFSSQRLSF